MSKIVLNDVTNLNALSVINDNFDKIEQELQNKVLYRDNPEGEPNALQDDVDANGNSLYNIKDLTINGAFTVQGQDVGAYIGQAAVSAADALASKTAAATSASNSQASATSSATSAATATAQATIATTKASESSASATASAASASTASTQAGISTAQATIATTQAGIATTQATNAAASASTSTTQAGIATTQASNASASATSATASATDAAASAAAAATALDNFDDRYLGSKATAPTLDNDGMALLTGALYYNNGTVNVLDKGMWVYDGGNWIKTSAASQAILTSYTYVATAGQTSFSGADVNSLVLSYTAGSIFPTLNGQRLRNGVDYTATTGSTFVLAVAAAAGDELIIDAFSTFNVANVYTKAEEDVKFAAKLDTTAGAVGNTNLAANSVTLTKLAREGIAGQVLTSNGPSSDPVYTTMTNSYVGARGATFTTPGTTSWTVPPGVTAVKVLIAGGGASGGGATTNGYAGSAGGSGACALSYITGLTPGASISVTVGAGGAATTGAGNNGGTSSFGAYITCTGGTGGQGNKINNATWAGGAGGTVSGTYSIGFNGYAGDSSYVAGKSGYYAGAGKGIGYLLGVNGGFFGLVSYGTMGSTAPNLPTNSNAASGFGASSGGAYKNGSGGSAGAGAPGIVMLEW